MRAILVGTLKMRVRDLAGDDVDLVVERDRDDHVGLVGAGCFQHVRMRAVADEAAHVQRVADRLDQFRLRCR